jgi:hypothetical protein
MAQFSPTQDAVLMLLYQAEWQGNRWGIVTMSGLAVFDEEVYVNHRTAHVLVRRGLAEMDFDGSGGYDIALTDEGRHWASNLLALDAVEAPTEEPKA